MIEERRARGCKNVRNAYFWVIITVYGSSFVTFALLERIYNELRA